jgi:hypothetical protein
VSIWAVVNPTPGAKTLSVVQALGQAMTAEMQTYIGTVTTSVAAACINAQTTANSNQNSSLPAIAGTTGDMAVGAFVTIGTINSINQTQIWLLNTNRQNAGARAANAGSSITFTLAQAAGAVNAGVGCDIVAAATAPFIPVDYSTSRTVPRVLSDATQALNLNLFKNPIPFAQYDWGKPFAIRPAPPQPTPVNLSIYSPPVVAQPFAQYDWNKPAIPRLAKPLDPAFNPNLFTNPIPFGPYDYGRGPARVPSAPRDYSQGLNLSLIAVPFAQLDWSKPIRFAPAPRDMSAPMNLSLMGTATQQLHARPFFVTMGLRPL